MLKLFSLAAICVAVGFATPTRATAQDCGYCETVYDGDFGFYSHIFWTDSHVNHACWAGPGGGPDGCHFTYSAQACIYYHNWCASGDFRSPNDAFDAVRRTIADARAVAELLARNPKQLRLDSGRGVVHVTSCDGAVTAQVPLTGQQHLALALALREAVPELRVASLSFSTSAPAESAAEPAWRVVGA